MKHLPLTLGLIAALAVTSSIRAQQPAPAGAKAEEVKPSPPANRDATPLRLVLTISRYRDEKKISSLPYSLSVSIGGPPVRFRMGADVPYAVGVVSDTTKTQSYSYRTVGVGIDVTGQIIVQPGLYKMDINVSDSSVGLSNEAQRTPTVANAPLFRNFSTNGSLLLRDGQTAQLTTSADPITGEIMRVDVTLNVVK